jgi:hypothetical protein
MVTPNWKNPETWWGAGSKQTDKDREEKDNGREIEWKAEKKKRKKILKLNIVYLIFFLDLFLIILLQILLMLCKYF